MIQLPDKLNQKCEYMLRFTYNIILLKVRKNRAVKRVEDVLISGDLAGYDSTSWKCLFVQTEFASRLVRPEESNALLCLPC